MAGTLPHLLLPHWPSGYPLSPAVFPDNVLIFRLLASVDLTGHSSTQSALPFQDHHVDMSLVSHLKYLKRVSPPLQGSRNTFACSQTLHLPSFLLPVPQTCVEEVKTPFLIPRALWLVEVGDRVEGSPGFVSHIVFLDLFLVGLEEENLPGGKGRGCKCSEGRV